MVGSALGMVTLADSGWVNPKMLPMAEIVATWTVNEAGTFSGLAAVRDVHRLGYSDLMGKWLLYDHPTQGVWGGIVLDEPGDLDNGTIEVSAVSMHALLIDRTAPVLFQQDTAHAGAIFRRALTTALTSDPLPFDSVQCDESGPVADVEWRGDSLYDLATSLADSSGQEFDVTVDRERAISAIWRDTIGEDKRDRVLLAEGYHVAGGRIDRSRTTITNDITGIAADQDYERSVSAQVASSTSIARYGRVQTVRRYDQVVTSAAIRAKVRADLRAEQDGVYLPTITISALDPLALDIRHGDTVRLWSHTKNRELDFRILSRTVHDSTALELAGVATEVRIPPVVRPFTPDALSGLHVWLDAMDLDTLTIAGSEVKTWLDKSVNGLTFIPDGNPVAYITSGLLEGRPVISTTTAAATMGNYIGPSLNLSAFSAVTVFAIARPFDNAAVEILSFPDAPFGTPTIDFTIERDAGDFLYGSVRPGGATPAAYRSASTWSNDYHLVTYTVDLALSSNEPTLYDDGALTGSRPSNGNNAGPLGSGWLMIGSYWNVAEVILYSRVLTQTQRRVVESYLRKKWGL